MGGHARSLRGSARSRTFPAPRFVIPRTTIPMIDRTPAKLAERIFDAMDAAADRGFWPAQGDRYASLTQHILGLMGVLSGADGTASDEEIAFVMEMARPFQPQEPTASETAGVVRKAARGLDLAAVPDWFRAIVQMDHASGSRQSSDVLWC